MVIIHYRSLIQGKVQPDYSKNLLDALLCKIKVIMNSEILSAVEHESQERQLTGKMIHVERYFTHEAYEQGLADENATPHYTVEFELPPGFDAKELTKYEFTDIRYHGKPVTQGHWRHYSVDENQANQVRELQDNRATDKKVGPQFYQLMKRWVVPKAIPFLIRKNILHPAALLTALKNPGVYLRAEDFSCKMIKKLSE